MQDIARYGYGMWLNDKRQYEINMEAFLTDICSEQKMAQNLKMKNCVIPQFKKRILQWLLNHIKG